MPLVLGAVHSLLYYPEDRSPYGFNAVRADATESPVICDVLSNDEAVAPVDTTLSLLKIDRVARQIPMNNVAAVPMKVQSLLADRSRR